MNAHNKKDDEEIKHMSYECPGLHGPECRQDIKPMTVLEMLSTIKQLTIPLFQRSYCWGTGSSVYRENWSDPGIETKLVYGWWRDLMNASIENPHRVGTIKFYKDRNGSDQLLVIDGQQRTTTT